MNMLSPGAYLNPSLVAKIFVAPGNGGTSFGSKSTNVPISASDFPKLVEFAVKNDVSLVIPGPEQPLVDGIDAYFRKGMGFAYTHSSFVKTHTLPSF